MKILSFIQALLPKLEKSKIIEDLRISSAELDNVVIPSFTIAAEYFKGHKIKSDHTQKLTDIFYRNVSLTVRSKQPTVVNEIALMLVNLRQNATYVEDQLEVLLEHDIIAEGLTAKKALFIRAAEAISYVSRYSLEFLCLVYNNEAYEVNAEVGENIKMVPATVKYVDAGMLKFAKAISDYGIPNDKFKKIFTAVPDVIVGGKAGNAVAGIYKENEIDPFSSGYTANFTYNPIYHIRLTVAEWQANRYKANKEKKKVLELRLLHLKMLQEQKNDAKLENEINYIQGRIDKLERYLRSVEEELGD